MLLLKGKNVPCLITNSEKGSITGKILRDMLATLDTLKVFPRDNNITPFLLLDGHQSRFDLSFLEYINAKDHEWCVCIGVPYGTGFWQVGDSSQQNGRFKIYCSKKKKEIVRYKTTNKAGGADVLPEDIILIVNYAWKYSFADVVGNKTAIAERGWCPYNRNLLLDPKIRGTMTPDDKKREKDRGLVPTRAMSSTQESEYTYDPQLLVRENQQTDLTKIPVNTSTGFAAYVLDGFVAEERKQASRDRTQNKKEESKLQGKKHDVVKQKLKAPSAGKKFWLETFVLG